jgi:NAD(P)-dependent dehydrogenase (short-subunit alcohol dehydrogenase family)
MGRLAGKVALITGGTSGIGEATARLFAMEGANVAFTGRRLERGKQVEAEIAATGRQAVYIPADHTRAEDCRQAVETVVLRLGRLDILFNNAGVVLRGNAEQTSEAEWQ